MSCFSCCHMTYAVESSVKPIQNDPLNTLVFHFRDVAKTDMLRKPFHDYILPKDDCLSVEQCVLELDMSNVTAQDLENIVSDFEFIVKKDGQLHGFCTWFEVEFSPFSEDIEMVTLNTGPDHE